MRNIQRAIFRINFKELKLYTKIVIFVVILLVNFGIVIFN